MLAEPPCSTRVELRWAKLKNHETQTPLQTKFSLGLGVIWYRTAGLGACLGVARARGPSKCDVWAASPCLTMSRY